MQTYAAPAKADRKSSPPSSRSKSSQVVEAKAAGSQPWGAIAANVAQSAPGETLQSSNGLVIQRKMTLGEVGDKYEKEADRLAPKVVNHINSPTFNTNPQQVGNPLKSQLQALRPNLQLKSTTAKETVSSNIESKIARNQGRGRSLKAGLQGRLSQAMGADFEHVRVHADTEADQLNCALSSRAFTTGQDIFFKAGEYRPETQKGQALIAHELTHVLQQQKARDAAQKVIHRKAYVGANYAELRESDYSLQKAKDLIQDPVHRRFKNKQEFRQYVQQPDSENCDHIGEMQDDRGLGWRRVDEFIVLGEDHSRNYSYELIQALQTNRFIYEGFTKEKSSFSSRQEAEDKHGLTGRAADTNRSHALESEIPKYLRTLPDVVLLSKVQSGNANSPHLEKNERTYRPGASYADFANSYNYTVTICKIFKQALEFCKEVGETDDNRHPLWNLYYICRHQIDTSIDELNEKEVNTEIPDISALPIYLSMGNVISAFQTSVEMELDLGGQGYKSLASLPFGLGKQFYKRRDLDGWSNMLDQSGQEPSDSPEANRYDRYRDRSMYLNIKEAEKRGDLIAVIGDSHRQRLQPLLDKKGIKHQRDKNFLKEQENLNIYAGSGEYHRTDDQNKVGEWIITLNETKLSPNQLADFGWGRENLGEDDWNNTAGYFQAGTAELPILENTDYELEGQVTFSGKDSFSKHYTYQKGAIYKLYAIFSGSGGVRRKVPIVPTKARVGNSIVDI